MSGRFIFCCKHTGEGVCSLCVVLHVVFETHRVVCTVVILVSTHPWLCPPDAVGGTVVYTDTKGSSVYPAGWDHCQG